MNKSLYMAFFAISAFTALNASEGKPKEIRAEWMILKCENLRDELVRLEAIQEESRLAINLTFRDEVLLSGAWKESYVSAVNEYEKNSKNSAKARAAFMQCQSKK